MTLATDVNIAALPGDGIVTEIMHVAENVLSAVESRTVVTFRLKYQKAGARHYLDTNVALPESVLRVCDQADAMALNLLMKP